MLKIQKPTQRIYDLGAAHGLEDVKVIDYFWNEYLRLKGGLQAHKDNPTMMEWLKRNIPIKKTKTHRDIVKCFLHGFGRNAIYRAPGTNTATQFVGIEKQVTVPYHVVRRVAELEFFLVERNGNVKCVSPISTADLVETNLHILNGSVNNRNEHELRVVKYVAAMKPILRNFVNAYPMASLGAVGDIFEKQEVSMGVFL